MSKRRSMGAVGGEESVQEKKDSGKEVVSESSEEEFVSDLASGGKGSVPAGAAVLPSQGKKAGGKSRQKQDSNSSLKSYVMELEKRIAQLEADKLSSSMMVVGEARQAPEEGVSEEQDRSLQAIGGSLVGAGAEEEARPTELPAWEEEAVGDGAVERPGLSLEPSQRAVSFGPRSGSMASGGECSENAVSQAPGQNTWGMLNGDVGMQILELLKRFSGMRDNSGRDKDSTWPWNHEDLREAGGAGAAVSGTSLGKDLHSLRKRSRLDLEEVAAIRPRGEAAHESVSHQAALNPRGAARDANGGALKNTQDKAGGTQVASRAGKNTGCERVAEVRYAEKDVKTGASPSPFGDHLSEAVKEKIIKGKYVDIFSLLNREIYMKELEKICIASGNGLVWIWKKWRQSGLGGRQHMNRYPIRQLLTLEGRPGTPMVAL